MLDIKKIEENPEEMKRKLIQRNVSVETIDSLLSMNVKRKNLIQEVETTKAEQNKLARDIGELKKTKQDASQLMGLVASLKQKNVEKEEELQLILEQQKTLLLSLPNIADPSVTVGASEEQNVELHRFGKPRVFNFPILDHTDLGTKLGQLDFEAATKITGARFSVLKGNLARLERALINFMLDFHLSQGYLEVIPPFIAHERSLTGTGNLPKFKDQLFKLEGQDWYLIPTSEVTLTNIKRDEIFEEKEFPLLYAAYSPCFRSEAGSHGRDVKGLIRMHQFNKVEMVNIVHPQDSERAHQAMIKSACSILEKLNLPYRAMQLCTGDMGFSAQKTVDLEVWLPSQQKYREISSLSNCGDFQARRAGIRFRSSQGKVEFAHTLNGSGLAVGRTLLAIMENYQEQDGSITVPEPLRPYMGGLAKIS
jgi:seryl-tRNA synthetase